MLSKSGLVLLALVAMCATVQAVPGAMVTIEFDNTLKHVQNNMKTVEKYVAEKLCRVKNGMAMAVVTKDESTMLNSQSKVQFFCAGNPQQIIKECGGMWNRHQVKDEIEDHTTPDVEVEKVLQCGPAADMAMARTSGRKMAL